MAIFFNTTRHKDYLHLDRKKYTSSFWNIPLVLVFIVFPIIFLIVKSNIIIILVLTVLFVLGILAAWMGVEGIFYGFVKPLFYQNQGKKVVRELGKGIKIYK